MSKLVPYPRRNSPFPMLDELFGDLWSPVRSLMRESIRMDIKESDAQYTIEAELPGVARENIDLSLDNGHLLISVHTEEQAERNNEAYLQRERRSSSLARSFYLADAAAEGVSASLENGLLRISVPKLAGPTPNNRIPIQ